ncbi:MAG: hypothetical protein NVSMB45_03310 [Ginsengibacter sp.]
MNSDYLIILAYPINQNQLIMTRKITFLFAVLFSFSGAFAQFEGSKQIYHSPNLKEQIALHKIVAIIPFEASITYKRIPKNYDSSANKNEEKSLSKSLQQSMYTYLLRKSDKYSVSFQDVDKTNAILKSKGIIDKLDEITSDSLCKYLGVDAVVKCRYTYEKTASEAGAIAKAILLGSALGGKTGAGSLTMQIYNAKAGELLWRFYKVMDDSILSSTDVLMERMMRKVSRNFPYEK